MIFGQTITWYFLTHNRVLKQWTLLSLRKNTLEAKYE